MARLQRVVVVTDLGGTEKTEMRRGFARWWRGRGWRTRPARIDPSTRRIVSERPGTTSIVQSGVLASAWVGSVCLPAVIEALLSGGSWI